MVLCAAGCENSKPAEDGGAQTEPLVTEAQNDSAEEGNEAEDNSDEQDSSAATGDNSSAAGSLGVSLCEAFKADAADLKEVAANVEKAASEEFSLVTEDCSEGFLMGFSADIKGFSSGVKLAPMIGSIPFVAYVFETDDTAALMETLKTNADPRWNICTEARETVSEVSGNYVFFAMLPGEE